MVGLFWVTGWPPSAEFAFLVIPFRRGILHMGTWCHRGGNIIHHLRIAMLSSERIWTVAIVQRVYVSDIPRMCICTGPSGIPSISATLEGFHSEKMQPHHSEGFDSANGQLLHSQGRRASGEEWPLALWCCSSPKYGSAGQNMVGGLSV